MNPQSTVPLTAASAWLHDSLESLSRLAQLTNNWDSYGAEPPNETALAHAREVLDAMSEIDLEPSHIDPSAENGICLSIIHGSRYADIECFNSGEILAVTSCGDGQPNVWEVAATPLDIKAAVTRIQTYLRQ